MPSDATIKIEVWENRMMRGRFIVQATYTDDPYKLKTSGDSYAEEGLLHRWFGIGDSFETSLKKATCEAIQELKQEWDMREADRIRTENLEKFCMSVVHKCPDKTGED